MDVVVVNVECWISGDQIRWIFGHIPDTKTKFIIKHYRAGCVFIAKINIFLKNPDISPNISTTIKR